MEVNYFCYLVVTIFDRFIYHLLHSSNMRKNTLYSTFVIMFVFILGFFSNSLYALIGETQHIPAAFVGQTQERDSPQNFFDESDIAVYSHQVVLKDLNGRSFEWARIADTGSMDPVIDSDSHVLEIVPLSADEIKVGDIISYKSKYRDGTIIHRVIDKGIDNDGVYFILKGDNNANADPGKIRFSQIQRQVVAILY